MNNFDTTLWKIFKISDLFRIEKAKNIKSENAHELRGNDIPYITRTEFNNGCKHFINLNLLDKVEKGNCITIGGEGANVFYQPSDFISGNNITKIYNKNLNEDNALFIVSILKKEKYRYSYNRAFNKTCVENTEIKLPINKNGEPDWEYMSFYIKRLKENEKSISTISQSLSKDKIDLNKNNWKWFTIKNIFEIPKIKKYSSIPDNDGKTPFVSSTIDNNSIVKYIDEKPIDFKNIISITTNGVNAFTAKFQNKYSCYSTDSEIIYSHNMNKYSAMFIISILNLENYRYAYMRKPKNGLIGDTKIKLPVNFDGNPDWKFMEEYIKSLPYSKFI